MDANSRQDRNQVLGSPLGQARTPGTGSVESPTVGGTMFARVATFESTDPAADEQLMGQAMEIVKPLIKGLNGIQGHMARRLELGKSLSISFFDTEENAVAAEPVFDEDMPRALGDLMQQFSGRRRASTATTSSSTSARFLDRVLEADIPGRRLGRGEVDMRYASASTSSRPGLESRPNGLMQRSAVALVGRSSHQVARIAVDEQIAHEAARRQHRRPGKSAGMIRVRSACPRRTLSYSRGSEPEPGRQGRAAAHREGRRAPARARPERRPGVRGAARPLPSAASGRPVLDVGDRRRPEGSEVTQDEAVDRRLGLGLAPRPRFDRRELRLALPQIPRVTWTSGRCVRARCRSPRDRRRTPARRDVDRASSADGSSASSSRAAPPAPRCRRRPSGGRNDRPVLPLGPICVMLECERILDGGEMDRPAHEPGAGRPPAPRAAVRELVRVEAVDSGPEPDVRRHDLLSLGRRGARPCPSPACRHGGAGAVARAGPGSARGGRFDTLALPLNQDRAGGRSVAKWKRCAGRRGSLFS